MKVYTYSEARRNLADLLNLASSEGPIKIRRRDGREYILRASERKGSPADIDGVDTDITADEIVKFVRDGRARRYPED